MINIAVASVTGFGELLSDLPAVAADQQISAYPSHIRAAASEIERRVLRLQRNGVRANRRVRHLIRHVHMYSFTAGFPYPELFALLQRDGYTGYLSTELSPENPSPEEFLLMYAVVPRLDRAERAVPAARHPPRAGGGDSDYQYT